MALKNCIQTWVVLMRKDFCGPNACPLYLNEFEFVPHLFFKCEFSRTLWAKVLGALNIKEVELIEPLDQCLLWWDQSMEYFKTLPAFMAWGIWKVRNKLTY